jgi:hypothetical protein
MSGRATVSPARFDFPAGLAHHARVMMIVSLFRRFRVHGGQLAARI